MTCGGKIAKCRKEAGLTQTELADILGLRAAALCQWERDLRSPKLKTIGKIADALGVSVLELMCDEDVEIIMDSLRIMFERERNSRSKEV